MTLQAYVGIASFLVVISITAFWFYDIGSKKDTQISRSTLITFSVCAILTTLLGIGIDNKGTSGLAILFSLCSVGLISFFLGRSNLHKPQ